MIRVQEVALPILREALPGVSVVSVIPDVDHRTLPMVVLKRAGGTRNLNLPHLASGPVLEMTAVSADGLVEAELLYEEALDALYSAVADQTVVPNAGHLQWLREAQGATQTPSAVSDAWAVEGTVRIGLRPA